jgi:hypothetical protein
MTTEATSLPFPAEQMIAARPRGAALFFFDGFPILIIITIQILTTYENSAAAARGLPRRFLLSVAEKNNKILSLEREIYYLEE